MATEDLHEWKDLNGLEFLAWACGMAFLAAGVALLIVRGGNPLFLYGLGLSLGVASMALHRQADVVRQRMMVEKRAA